jgi:hypothetical protein
MLIHGRSSPENPPEKEKQSESGQTVIDSLNQVYHDVEDEEGYLVVVVFGGGI